MLLAAILFALAPTALEGRVIPHEVWTIDGTIVLEQESGTTTTPASGTIEFWLGGQGGEHFDALVSDGHFALELPRRTGWLDVGPIDIDGAPCFAWPWSERTWFAGLPDHIELVAHPVKPAFARFVDAETGKDLSEGWITKPTATLGELDERIEPLHSAFEIPLFTGEEGIPYRGWIGLREYAVIPDGYARRRISLDPSSGGTRTFEFEKAAELRIWVPSDGTSDPELVRVQPEWSNEYWPCSRGSIVAGVDGSPSRQFIDVPNLPSGTWKVWTAPSGTSDAEAAAPERVTLRAGEVAEVHLKRPAAPIERENLLELHGSLRLPEGLDPASIVLRFRPKRWEQASNFRPTGRKPMVAPADISGAQLVRDAKDARILHWFAGDANAGTWVASIEALSWSQEFEHDSDAAIAFSLQLPAATTPPEAAPQKSDPIRVRIVDGVNGRPLGPAQLDVRPLDRAGSAIWKSDDSTWSLPTSTESAHVEIGVPRGPTVRYEIARPMAGEVAMMTFWRDFSIEVRAYDGDARIGAPEIYGQLSPVVEALAHDGRAFFPSATAILFNTFTTRVTQPGRYRIALPPNARYAPHAPVEVEVKAGEPMPVAVLRLQRAPH